MAKAPVAASAVAHKFPPGLSFEFLCKLSDIKSKRKELFRLTNGRGVLLMYINDQVTCYDHACYHHGAPLYDAEIEDLGGVSCLVCPWHKYKIDVSSGQCMYIGIDIATRTQELKSKGPKQRIHFVDIRGDDVYVADSSGLELPEGTDVSKLPAAVGSAPLPSDTYAKMPFNVGQTLEKTSGVALHSSFGR